MYINRCQDQNSWTLDELYIDMTENERTIPDNREAAKAMLDLLARLRALPDERCVYGTTSHYQLYFHAQDTYTSPWFVSIGAVEKHTYFVEYLMPERFAPWPQAHVSGWTHSEDDAVQMILTAMEKSEGWLDKQ